MAKRKAKGATAPGPFDRLDRGKNAARDNERERALVEATENLARAMEARGVNQGELARRAGWTRSMVSRLLSGGHACSLRSLTDAYRALGYEIAVGYRLPTGSPQAQAVPRERVPKAAKRIRTDRR